METGTFLLIGAALIAIVVFMYVILPRINSRFPNMADGLRIASFFGVMIYLGWDFYTKQKYFIMILQAAASIAFVYAMLQKRKAKR